MAVSQREETFCIQNECFSTKQIASDNLQSLLHVSFNCKINQSSNHSPSPAWTASARIKLSSSWTMAPERREVVVRGSYLLEASVSKFSWPSDRLRLQVRGFTGISWLEKQNCITVEENEITLRDATLM